VSKFSKLIQPPHILLRWCIITISPDRSPIKIRRGRLVPLHLAQNSHQIERRRIVPRDRTRSHHPQTGEPLFEVGGLRVDLSRREVTIDGKAIHLTPNEFRLMAVLVKNARKVLTHRQLLREVWGPESNEETHYLRVYMNQLRQKLETDSARPQYLRTESGVGYRVDEI
jgi:two-component system KDP operon response regulator KdpE